MKKLLNIYACLLLIPLIYGCVDPISFETGTDSSQIIIYGHFSQLQQDYTIDISRTSGFGILPNPISGACVKIMDGIGNFADYQEVEPGKYLLTPDKLQGVPGRSYQIEIILADGISFLSMPQVLPEPVEPDDLYFEIGSTQILGGSGSLIDKTVLNVFIDTPLPSSSEAITHLRWTVEEVYSFVDRSCGPFDPAETCYFIDPIDDAEVLLFENQGGGQDYLTRFRIRTRELVPFDEFTARHYFLVSQHTISKQEFDYWEKIDAVANQSGNLFDVQPAAVSGNIYQKGDEQVFALGYFAVNAEIKLRTFTTPFDIKPHPVFTCMDESFYRDHLPECCFCTTKEGIRIERPDYWDED
jgi:hypothetical protein